MSQFASRLPDDPSYWDGLAARIVGAAEPALREQREAHAWWHPFARWSPVIGVSAAVAALLVVLLGPPAPAHPTFSFGQLIGPEDPVAQAVVGGAATPDVAAMLLFETGGRP